MRRIVVTGLGAFTPIGKNTNETWKNLLAGKSGIGKISNFEISTRKTILTEKR